MKPAGDSYFGHPFEVSDKVICIDAELTADRVRDFTGALIYHKVYVVRSVGHDDEGGPWVCLVGLFGEPTSDGSEAAFKASRFLLLRDYKINYAETKRARDGVKIKVKSECRKSLRTGAKGMKRFKVAAPKYTVSVTEREEALRLAFSEMSEQQLASWYQKWKTRKRN